MHLEIIVQGWCHVCEMSDICWCHMGIGLCIDLDRIAEDRELIIYTCKEFSEDSYYGVVTQKVICGSSNYQDIFGGSCTKGVNSMFYDMLYKT